MVAPSPWDAWISRLDELRRVAFDTNALVDLLGQTEPHATLVAAVLQRVAQGAMVGIVSTIVEMELLARPIREGNSRAIDQVGVLLYQIPGMTVHPVDSAIARRAANIRAATRLTAADSIVSATAADQGCDALIGNDVQVARRFREVPYLLLRDYVRR